MQRKRGCSPGILDWASVRAASLPVPCTTANTILLRLLLPTASFWLSSKQSQGLHLIAACSTTTTQLTTSQKPTAAV